MKGKRHATEDKIRILREADQGERTIPELCREQNISEVTFHRRKKQFGHMEVKEARRLKELERENSELKNYPPTARRTRSTAAGRQQLLAEFDRSGLSGAAFARQHRIA